MLSSNDSFEELKKTLLSVGLQKGDAVWVVSNIAAFGPIPNVSNILDFYYNAIKSIIGDDGTIVVLSYTFDFIKEKIYKHEETPTKHGVFNEFVRNQTGAIRSLHPFASYAALGKNASKYCGNTYTSAWGYGSPVDQMINNSTKVLVMGLPSTYIPVLHYYEEMLGAPFAYHKILKGNVSASGNDYSNNIYTAYLRYKYLDIKYNIFDIEKEVVKETNIKVVRFKRSKISCIEVGTYGEYIKDKMVEDIHYFLKEIPDYSEDNYPMI